MPDAQASQPVSPILRLGSYRLIEPLGSGGMSSVFRARHEGTGYEVAIKVLPRYLAKNPVLLRRFDKEAHSVASLQHPNIVPIYDRGSEGGRHYLVLEYVNGSDLHDLVRKKGPLEVLEALRVIAEAARGLRYAARIGVIHRDIKPANILMDPEGHVKLIDLGLALQSASEDERVTRDGTTVGTVDYMAPEQARDSRAASIRSDIYSLGCTLHFLLSGLPPFPGGDIVDKLRRHAQVKPPDLRAIRPDIPEPVALLALRMLSKNPESRFSDYDELLSALDALARTPMEAATVDALIDEEGPEDVAPVDALIVDDDEDENENENENENDEESRSPQPNARAEPDFALIDDEDDDDADFSLGCKSSISKVSSTADAFPPVPSSRASSGSHLQPKPEPAAEPEPGLFGDIALAELAELEDDAPAISRRAVPERPRIQPASKAPDPYSDLDEMVVPLAGPARMRMPQEEESIRSWIIGGALVGLLIALLGFGIISLVRSLPERSSDEAEQGDVLESPWDSPDLTF